MIIDNTTTKKITILMTEKMVQLEKENETYKTNGNIKDLEYENELSKSFLKILKKDNKNLREKFGEPKLKKIVDKQSTTPQKTTSTKQEISIKQNLPKQEIK